MRDPASTESRTPAVAYVDADRGQLRLFESQFGDRFRLSLASSGEELLEQVESVAPVAALLADHDSGRGLFEVAPSLLPDTERLLVARTKEQPQARAAVERGTAKRYFLKPWAAGEVGAALEDAVRIFELRSQVRSLRARLDQSERFATLGRVSAGIAHELAGPAMYVAENAAALRRELVGVAAYVRRVSRIRPDARVLDRLREISEIVQDVEAGAEHVRQVSREVTGQLRAESPIERCDVPELVLQVARLVRPELQGRALLTSYGGPLAVLASPLRLTQVLINLVVNAAQAVGSMGRDEPGRVQVRWLKVGNKGRIEVVDDGPGLPDQVENGDEILRTTKPKESGTGLGLWLCRELMGQMGGSLQLSSPATEGTVARLELPIAR
ncbi:MAG TPA: hybrid sensor histidine kinase/response regulator [Myxococcaceae bacterium]|nr:hybrid sensor histidine kinase/response regulator [Myxococcaceae bacterium]